MASNETSRLLRGLRFVFTRTVPIAFILSWLGIMAAVISSHGPPFVDVIATVLIPGASLARYLTGSYIGTSRVAFGLFVALQLVYYHILITLWLTLGQESRRTR